MKNWIKSKLEIFRLWYVWKYSKVLINPQESFKRLINIFNMLRKYKNIETVRRNLVAAIIKKARIKYPYFIIDYSKARLAWDIYHQIDGHLKSFEELKDKEGEYVTIILKDASTRGKRYESYYINWDSSDKIGIVYKIGKKSQNYNYIDLISVDGKTEESIDKNNYTKYRYSTEDECWDYKTKEGLIQILQKEQCDIKKELLKMEEEINKLVKFK